jgi:hypothetical protein
MAIGATEKERKKFFFEKKNQKLFPRLQRGFATA